MKNIHKQITFVTLGVLASSIASAFSPFVNSANAVTLTVGTPYTQDFDSLPTTGATNAKSTLPLDWDFTKLGAPTSITYSAGTGSSTTGDVYSFGTSGSNERALGSLNINATGTINYGIKFTIAGATTPVTSVEISYRGEQWRLGPSTNDLLAFYYSTSSTANLSNIAYGGNGTSAFTPPLPSTISSWTNISSLNFASKVTSGSAGALDGNLSANYTNISGTITGLNLNDGDTLWIAWSDPNVSGNDNGLAIDNVRVNAVPEPITMFGSLTALAIGAGLKKFRKKCQA
ncbi:hypothetical protein RIVM261_028550 [Rivularia sp. IAM M-261]|nr:hypothetical protein RIVM261_028550 [Rivularia sp. IAM M-261]